MPAICEALPRRNRSGNTFCASALAETQTSVSFQRRVSISNRAFRHDPVMGGKNCGVSPYRTRGAVSFCIAVSTSALQNILLQANPQRQGSPFPHLETRAIVMLFGASISQSDRVPNWFSATFGSRTYDCRGSLRWFSMLCRRGHAFAGHDHNDRVENAINTRAGERRPQFVRGQASRPWAALSVSFGPQQDFPSDGDFLLRWGRFPDTSEGALGWGETPSSCFLPGVTKS